MLRNLTEFLSHASDSSIYTSFLRDLRHYPIISDYVGLHTFNDKQLQIGGAKTAIGTIASYTPPLLRLEVPAIRLLTQVDPKVSEAKEEKSTTGLGCSFLLLLWLYLQD